jgi:ATP-dependent DNA ligase
MHARIDGELCALNDDGVPVFSGLQAAIDEGPHRSARLFAFDLLFGEATASLPLVERKAKLKRHFRKKIDGLLYTDHVAGDGPSFCKRADQPYAPGGRWIWVKPKWSSACRSPSGRVTADSAVR